MEAGADITLMDPWTICSHNELGETLVTVHTQKGDELLQQCVSLNLEPRSFSEVEPALSLKDVWRKQVTEPVYRGRPCKKTLCPCSPCGTEAAKIVAHGGGNAASLTHYLLSDSC